MPHGYTNRTTGDGRVVTKSYLGPGAALRCAREADVLTGLAGRLPVPRVLGRRDGRLELEFIPGVPGQQLVDDGRAEAMLWADPLLADAGVKATMFVITQAAGSSGIFYASWKQLRQYAASGRWDLESHTAGQHYLQTVADGRALPALASLKSGESIDAYRTRVRDDLASASDELERETGRRPVAFAFPFGDYGAERTNDPRIESVLTSAVGHDYQLAFEQDDQPTVPLVACSADPLHLRRIDVGHWSGRELLQRVARAAAQSPASTSCPA